MQKMGATRSRSHIVYHSPPVGRKEQTMLSHLTRLIGIVNACNAALANLSDPRSLAEVATMKQTAEILMSSLATDDPNRDATLELVWASPLNFALACQVVNENPAEDVETTLYLIAERCYLVADATETGTRETVMHEPHPMDRKVSLAASIRRGAWGPFHRQQKYPSKPRGSTLSDKRKAVA